MFVKPGITACLALAAAMAGCAVGPRFQRPTAPENAGFAPVPLPDVTASVAAAGGTGQRLVAGGEIPADWWLLFQSPTLTALIEQALVANPTLAAAKATLAQTQEMVAAQRGFFYPSVGATYQAERHKVSGNTNSSATIGVQGNGVNLLPKIPESPDALKTFPHALPSYYTFYTAELTVGFVPDVFGSNRRQVESLAAQAEAQRFDLEAVNVTLASTVAATAIQGAALSAQIRLTRDLIETEQQSLQILRDQFRLGFAMRIDVAAQEAALAQVMATLPPLEKQRALNRDLTRALCGALPTRDAPELELDALQLPPEMPLGLPARLVEQRPDVRAAEAQLHAADANVGVAVAAMLPQFNITGAYGGNATRMTQLFDTGGPFWSLVGNVNQPVFQGGTLLHQKRAAGAALRQAAYQYRSTVTAAFQNVADTLHVTLADAATFAADVEAEHSAAVTYDLTRQQLNAGYVTYLALLSAEAAYQQTSLARVQAQAVRYTDAVALFQALGGGWWNRQALAAR